MKVYIDANDMGKTVTYKEENGKRQYLYVHDNEGFIFKGLEDHTKQVRKEVCEEIKEKLKKQYPNVYANIGESLFCSDCYLRIKDLAEILDQLQGEDK